MELSSEQQQAMEAQKAQCPFCKIVKGEIPSKKVYEDDLLLGVLDINPASKGHVLLMPKEHYPIMPLIPPPTFEHLFAKTKLLSKAAKEGVLTFGDTVYIANGFAAGQQSSHFMLHIIPREDNDGLDFFSPKSQSLDQTKLAEAFKLLKHNLPIMLRNRYAQYPLEGKAPATAPGAPVAGGPVADGSVEGSDAASGTIPGPTGRQYTKESLIQLVESNLQLKQLITQYPEDFKKQINENVRLKDLFAHVDLDDIIAHFAPEQQSSEEPAETQEEQYTMDELVEIVNDNPQLRDLLLKQTLQFAQKVREVPKLQKIFGHVDIEELERAVLRKEVRQEEDVKDLLGSYAQQLGPAPIVDAEVEEEVIDDVTEMPQEEQENQGEAQTSEGNKEPSPETEQSESERIEAEQREPEHSESQQNESNEPSTQDDGLEGDLISRLHNEMIKRNV